MNMRMQWYKWNGEWKNRPSLLTILYIALLQYAPRVCVPALHAPSLALGWWRQWRWCEDSSWTWPCGSWPRCAESWADEPSLESVCSSSLLPTSGCISASAPSPATHTHTQFVSGTAHRNKTARSVWEDFSLSLTFSCRFSSWCLCMKYWSFSCCFSCWCFSCRWRSSSSHMAASRATDKDERCSCLLVLNSGNSVSSLDKP